MNLFTMIVVLLISVSCTDDNASVQAQDSESGADGDADTDSDADTDGDADSDTDVDADADADGDTDADADADTDADGDADSEPDSIEDTTLASCSYTCSAHCRSIGGTVMSGSCENPDDKCCDLPESDTTGSADTDTDADADGDTDTDSDTDTDTDTDSETDSDGDADGLCTTGPWPTADPAKAGPFETVTETDVGPTSSADGTQFTLFRPKDLSETELCHPVVTWGNGTSCTPDIYKVLLDHLASHGFVVIASNSGNVQKGDPKPMLLGVSWVLEQNDDPSSPMYQRIDTAHIGATGHSQGGFGTSEIGTDPRIVTTAPACGAIGSNRLQGPAFLLCGGNDTNVPCDSTVQSAFDGTSGQPVMLANHIESDHANWITMFGTTPSSVEIAITAWMRVQLMDDTELRGWFYGTSCELCNNSEWDIQQKQMEQ